MFLPYLRGQDIGRWLPEWDGEWLLALRSSNETTWPWTDAENAENVFRDTYPSVYAHMKSLEERLRDRKGNYRYWWELGGFSAWGHFAQPKIIYQEIQFHPSYAFDLQGYLSNNKTFILPTDDLYVLAVLNSPLMWWHNWRYLPHMKDEALTPVAFRMESLSIADPPANIAQNIRGTTEQLIKITVELHDTRRTMIDWLRVEHGIEKPGQRLEAAVELDSDAFVAEVKKRRGKKDPLSAAALKNLREEWTRTIEPARALAAEAMNLERQVSDLVNAAYGLTPEEIDLLWRTAPPRMPLRPLG